MVRSIRRLLQEAVLHKPSLNDTRVFYELQLAVDYIVGADVIGDVAEFGSHGRTASVICERLSSHKSVRKVHLFDSFQGFPKVTSPEDTESPHVISGVWLEGGSKSPRSPSQLRAYTEKYLPPDQIEIYEGWFKDTLDSIQFCTKFSLIHIDCDLFEPTREVLLYLFCRGHISPGCIILFDDWNCNRASPDYGERRAWASVAPKFNVQFSDGGDYGWAGHKLRIHSYG